MAFLLAQIAQLQAQLAAATVPQANYNMPQPQAAQPQTAQDTPQTLQGDADGADQNMEEDELIDWEAEHLSPSPATTTAAAAVSFPPLRRFHYPYPQFPPGAAAISSVLKRLLTLRRDDPGYRRPEWRSVQV